MSSAPHAQPDPFEAERRAWHAVAFNPPGSPNHDPEAWDTWRSAAEQAGNDSAIGDLGD